MDAETIKAIGQYIVLPITSLVIFIALLYFGTK